MTHQKAVVISQGWASIFGVLLTSFIIGGVTFAWNVYGETTNLKSQMDDVRRAELPSRMDRLEEKVAGGFANTSRTLDKVDQKLDKIDLKLSESEVRDRRVR